MVFGFFFFLGEGVKLIGMFFRDSNVLYERCLVYCLEYGYEGVVLNCVVDLKEKIFVICFVDGKIIFWIIVIGEVLRIFLGGYIGEVIFCVFCLIGLILVFFLKDKKVILWYYDIGKCVF